MNLWILVGQKRSHSGLPLRAQLRQYPKQAGGEDRVGRGGGQCRGGGWNHRWAAGGQKLGGMRADVDRGVSQGLELALDGGEVDHWASECGRAFAGQAVDGTADLIGDAAGVVVKIAEKKRAIGSENDVGGQEELAFFFFFEGNERAVWAHVDS